LIGYKTKGVYKAVYMFVTVLKTLYVCR